MHCSIIREDIQSITVGCTGKEYRPTLGDVTVSLGIAGHITIYLSRKQAEELEAKLNSALVDIDAEKMLEVVSAEIDERLTQAAVSRYEAQGHG